jgi:hypothetical protein
VREFCGSQLCSVVLRRANVQRAPLGKLLNLQVTSSQLLAHNAGVEGSSPSLSTNQISVIPRQREFASPP